MRRHAKGLQCVAAFSHWQGRTLGQRFAAWRCAAAEAAAREVRADAHFRSACWRRSLVAWRQQARRQALLARCGAALAQKSTSTILRAHLRAWLAATERRQQRRDVVVRCLARLANHQLSKAFSWWRQVAQKRQLACRCAAWLSQRHAAAALQQWRSWVGVQQAKSKQAAACLQRMLQWRLAAAWRLWRGRVVAWGAERQRLERCIALLRRAGGLLSAEQQGTGLACMRCSWWS